VFSLPNASVYFLFILSETDEGYSKTWYITASELIILEEIIFAVISVLALTWYVIYIFSNLKLPD
jgi:hypothetical protein